MFLKDNLDQQGGIYQGGTSHIISVAHNGQIFGVYFLVKALRNNVEAKFSGHMSMFKESFQLDTMTLASKS